MDKLYVIFEFELENGSSKEIRVNDIRQDIDDASLMALGNLLIEKNSKWNGSAFVNLNKCSKYRLEETKII